jgi:hypothetical protein
MDRGFLGKMRFLAHNHLFSSVATAKIMWESESLVSVDSAPKLWSRALLAEWAPDGQISLDENIQTASSSAQAFHIETDVSLFDVCFDRPMRLRVFKDTQILELQATLHRSWNERPSRVTRSRSKDLAASQKGGGL